MSGARFGEVDHDLLADYVGGALDGTAEADAVAGRIAGDPGWARAHEELMAALAAVESDLSAFAATTGTMPADVAARIDAALTAAPPISGEGTEPAAEEPQRPHLTVIQGERRAPRPRSSRWIRWAGGGVAAAALVAVAALGINSLLTGSASDNAASTAGGAAAPYSADSAGAGESQKDVGGGQIPAGPRVVASGTDYRRDTLAKAAALQADTPRQGSGSGTEGTAAPTGGAAPSGAAEPLLSRNLPTPLVRFSGARQLSDCLAAIVAAYGRSPVRIDVVDLASFEGRPAVIAVLSSTDNQRLAWVSGAECGTPAGGADTIYTSAVR